MKNQDGERKIDLQILIDLCERRYEKSLEVSPKIEQFKIGNSTLRAQAQNEGYCVTSDNARKRSKPRRSRVAGEA